MDGGASRAAMAHDDSISGEFQAGYVRGFGPWLISAVVAGVKVAATDDFSRHQSNKVAMAWDFRFRPETKEGNMDFVENLPHEEELIGVEIEARVRTELP
ncbi:hypothetical protein OROMI_007178 [Orobanche minor]